MNYSRDWRVISASDGQDAFTNMAVDEAIARTMVGSENGSALTLRIYTWSPNSISIGYFQKISDIVKELCKDPGCHSESASGGRRISHPPRFFASLRMTTRCRDTFLGSLADDIGLKDSNRNFDIVRRPTGGTAVVHDGGPSFSLILKDGQRMPSTKITDLYSLMGRCVVEALRHLDVSSTIWNGPKGPVTARGSNLCVTSLCPYDVVYQGEKVAGYAARRFQGVTLLQGYITLTDGLVAQELRDAMIDAVKGVTGAKFLDGALTEEENALATRLRADKYTRREWNYKR
ncbi:MAG: biotin/lipoate A/B protein ligase family protein [Candidatus Brocadiales bacterium]